MNSKKPNLSEEELARPFNGEWATTYPPIMTPEQLAMLLGKSIKTIYEWLGKGRLDGSFRKRGKGILLWRDRVLKTLFDGKDWH